MTPGSETNPVRLAAAFAEVADALAAEETVEATLDKICRLAVATIAACDHCGVSVLQRGEIITVSATGPAPRRFDELQNETRQGPALEAIRQHDIVHVARLSAERRCRNLARRTIAETGIESILAFPLFTESGPLGVLQLHSTTARIFSADATARSVGSVFAAHVGVALAQARRVEQLEEAIQTRDLIGQAKGILMAQEHLTAEQAFERLREVSQRLNRKLRDIAEEVAYTGRLPSEE